MIKGIQKNFSLPKYLAKNWDNFLPKGSKESSANAAAALLLYMVVEPSLREKLRELAFTKNIEEARIEARKALREIMIHAYLTGFIGLQSEEDKKILLEHFVQKEKDKQA